MSGQPDPKRVREIARRSLTNDIHRGMPGWFAQGAGSLIHSEAGPGGLSVEDFSAWHEAVVKQISTAQITVSWLDEHPDAGLRGDRITAGELAEVITKHPEWTNLPVHMLPMNDEAVWLGEVEYDCFNVNDGPVLSLLAYAPAVAAGEVENRHPKDEEPDAEPDLSGWSAEDNAEFEKMYGAQAAMRLRAASDRVWTIVQELRDEAVKAGRDPHQDPMAQRLSAALVGADDA
jgi:hypothetical protein